MSLYLARARYTADAFKGMIAKPEDRAAPVKAMFEAAGAKLLHVWFTPSTRELRPSDAANSTALSL